MGYELDCAIWETTLGCNLKCSHCGSKAGVARTDELDTKECLSLCEQLAELSCNNVALMGGELFLRDDWFDIASCISDLGMKLSLVSNGQILERYIDDLVQLNPVVVGISVDGLSKTHDTIRGVSGALKR
ncbi:MAG: radical SAM protein, partial [Candidatus Hermodarchaeota archaeon]